MTRTRPSDRATAAAPSRTALREPVGAQVPEGTLPEPPNINVIASTAQKAIHACLTFVFIVAPCDLELARKWQKFGAELLRASVWPTVTSYHARHLPSPGSMRKLP